VLVRNPVPGNTRFVGASPEPSIREPELIWQLGTLEAGASRDIVLRLLPNGDGEINNCARVQYEHGQCVATKLAKPGIRLDKSGPLQAVLYDMLTYQLTVTNTGSTEVTGIMVTDSLPPGLEHATGRKQLTWDFGNLAPGQRRNVDYQLVAKTTGKLCNRAVATAAGGLRHEIESCVTVSEAKLTLTMRGPARQYMNQPAAYQLTVTNPGTVRLQNVELADPLPGKTTFVSASDGGQLSANEVRWAIGPLEPGASRTVELVLRAGAAERICHEATATAERGLIARAEACTDFEGAAGLQLEVVDTDDPVAVGGTTSYVILVRNQGTAKVTNIRLEARVPEQMAMTRATGPSDSHKDGQVVRFDPLTLDPKSDGRYTVYVKALKPGDVRFKVELRADQLTAGPVHVEESTTIFKELPPAGLPTPEGPYPSRSAASSLRRGAALVFPKGV
jgi:uncharacterized repeat protein (TIGR01451 family)